MYHHQYLYSAHSGSWLFIRISSPSRLIFLVIILGSSFRWFLSTPTHLVTFLRHHTDTGKLIRSSSSITTPSLHIFWRIQQRFISPPFKGVVEMSFLFLFVNSDLWFGSERESYFLYVVPVFANPWNCF